MVPAATTSSHIAEEGQRLAERHDGAGARGDRAIEEVAGGREILDGDAERLEQRDLVGRAPAGDPAEEDVPELARDVVVADRALALRDQEVAGLGERRLAAIDDQPRPRDRGGVELAHGGEARA